MAAHRKTKQRELIYNNLINRKDHPTAQMVHDSLKADNPNLSLATVYRNLHLLSDVGYLLRLDLGNDKIHFDGDTRAHAHFVCNECNEIYDIWFGDEGIQQYNCIDNENIHEVTSYSLTIQGVCKNCKEKKEN